MSVNDFLIELKKSIELKEYDFVPTEKNRNSRRKYGLTLLDIEDFLYSLDKEDLYKGPEKDRDCPGEELFIFKKEIKEGIIFYVKLKYKNRQIKIISLHEDE